VIKKVEVLANIAVIIVSIVLCSVLVKKYLFTSHAKQTVTAAAQPIGGKPSTDEIQPGTRLSLSGVDWSQSDRTLLLALSTTCRFCAESAPLYQRLQQDKPKNVRLLAVLPQSIDDSQKYLTKLGLNVPEVAQAPLISIGVRATPTLILIDKNGIVNKSWVGKLPDAEAAKVLAELSQPKRAG
jgi:thioredoxin-related protein